MKTFLIIYGIINLISLIWFIYEIKHAIVVPPDVDID